MLYAHAYPLAQGGGLFVFIVGLGIVLGALVPRARMILLGASGGIAALGLWRFASALSAPYGVPQPIQVWSLVVAIAFEIVGIPIAIRLFRVQDERSRNLVALLVVGVHFLLMTPAFGPVIIVLGLLAMLNAGLGLKSLALDLRTHWFLDGALKLAAGTVLWFVVPLFGA